MKYIIIVSFLLATSLAQEEVKNRAEQPIQTNQAISDSIGVESVQAPVLHDTLTEHHEEEEQTQQKELKRDQRNVIQTYGVDPLILPYPSLYYYQPLVRYNTLQPEFYYQPWKAIHQPYVITKYAK